MRELSTQRVLLTGATGMLGTAVREDLVGHVAALRLSGRSAIAPLRARETSEVASLEDQPAVVRLCQGIDAIVHLGGQATEAPWDVVHKANILGLINLYEAARVAGVRRILFASSNHAIGLHWRSTKLDEHSPARPDSRYGLSKAFGEDLAYLYAMKWGIESFVMRIGSCFPEPTTRRMLSTWQSRPDFCRLVRVGLTADYTYEIVYGVSANSRSYWDNSNALRLGYKPQDSADAWADKVGHVVSSDPIEEAFQGGSFVSAEFVGNVGRVPKD